MKTKYNASVMMLLAGLAMTACELDYAPENTLVDEKVYRNERTAEAALMGNYVRLNVFLSGAPQDQNNYSNTAYTFLLADIGTDNLSVRPSVSTFLAMETSEYSSNEHDGLLYNIWHWGYNAIDYSNNIIAGVPRYAVYDEKKQKQFVAEAKFIRAYIYFGLLCMYGDKALMGNDGGHGVVIRLDPYNGYDPDKIQGRETNATCWAQIIRDLEEAIPDLPTDVPDNASRIRANRTVAQALLSRVYLYKGTYTGNRTELEQARDLAKTVLQTPGYTFPTSSDEFSNALFPSNEYTQAGSYPDPTARSSELIFFEPSRLYTDNYPNGFAYYRKTSYFVPQTMKDRYDENDVRRTYLLWQGSKTDTPNDITTIKYSGGYYDDVIYFRLAEMKLTYAETLVRTSDTVSEEAVAQLNDVHQRAYPDGMKPTSYTTADFPTAEAFIKEVLTERNRELAYEGHYRWDIIRTGNLVGDAKMAAVDPARWNLPVPDYEIRISDGVITQNSGYN